MALSKRRWGYIFLGCGLFFLSIGLITGFLLPKIVVRVIEKMSCVDSFDDADYDKWAEEKFGFVTKLYYWEIENKDDFLYNGEIPKLKEKGPYVYVLQTKKIDVSFQDKRRVFKSWSKDPIFVKQKSCSNCFEDDNVTVLNLGYLGVMAKFGGDSNFALAYLPGTVNRLIALPALSYKQLGNINGSVWSDSGSSGWKNPEFGAWLMEEMPVDRNFTVAEMKGLYNVLKNQVTLFGQTLSNTTVKNSCQKINPVDQNCGFIVHLYAYNSIASLKIPALDLIENALCSNGNNESCFNRTDLIPMISRYMQHVSEYTMWIMLHEQDDIVQTISQKNLSHGYTMKQVLDPRSPSYERLKVLGLLRYYETEEDALNETLQQSIYTCEASKEKRHQWAAYNESESIPNWLFPNLTQDDEQIRGYARIVPHSETADKPCSFSQELPMKTFEMFVSPLSMKLRLRYKEDTTFYGLKLKRFVVTKEDFLNHSAVKYGTIDLSNLRKMPLVASMPHFLYSNVTIPTSFNQRPNEDKHQAISDIEPITGIISRAQLRVQINVPINKKSVSAKRIKPYNITYTYTTQSDFLHKGIPVVWIEYGGEAKESDINNLKKTVHGLLRLSCGFLVAFPILGGIFIIVAVILFVFSVKSNEISTNQIT